MMGSTVEAPETGPDAPPTPEPTARPGRFDVVALTAAITSVVTVSLVRVVSLGFVPVAPDDAAYIGVGRALWNLSRPVANNGDLYTIRSWVYPALVGGASRLIGDDPFTGPRILGWTLATTALVLAVVFAYKLARGLGAVATALAILMAPLLWTTVPTTRVEVALICSLMVVLLVMGKPSPRRMLLGGVLAGVTLLIKETSAPLVILPLAYLGTVPRDQWRRLATRYLLGFAVTVAWWFVTVLVLAGEIFPLQGIQQAQDRGVARDFTLDLSAQLLIALFVVGWLVVAIGRRHDPRARLLVLAGLAFVPAAAIAWRAELGLRQFVPIALLSCIALGIAIADGLTAVVRRVPRGATRLAGALVLVVVLVAVVPVALTQDRTTIQAAEGEDLDASLGPFITALPGEPAVLTTFKFSAQLWARVAGYASIRNLPFEVTTERPRLSSSLWIDASATAYASMPRENMVRLLRDAQYLVLSGPHRFGPVGLATWLRKHGKEAGITPVARFGPELGTPWADVFKLEHPQVDRIPTIVTSAAVDRMAAAGGFTPEGATAIAATRGWLKQYAAGHPTDGTVPYEPLRSAPR